MTRSTLTRDQIVLRLQQAVFAEEKTNVELQNVSLEPLSRLFVSPVPSMGRSGNVANWQYYCPEASDAILAALERHALQLKAEVNVA